MNELLWVRGSILHASTAGVDLAWAHHDQGAIVEWKVMVRDNRHSSRYVGTTECLSIGLH